MSKKSFYVGVNMINSLEKAHIKPEKMITSYLTNIKYAHETLGANAVQLFFGDATRVHRKLVKDSKELALLREIKKYITKNDIYFVVHSSFSINFCIASEHNGTALNGYLNELRNADVAGASGCVIHMGIFSSKRTKIEYKLAIKNYAENIGTIIKGIKKYRLSTRVILETPATIREISGSFETLLELYNLFTDDQRQYIRFCIDTAHIHSSGYDIRTEQSAKEVFEQFDSLIGLDLVDVIHYNDSKQPLGSNKDEHQAIGLGYIGNPDLGGSIDGLRYIATVAKQRGIPLVQETKDPDHKGTIKKIRQLF
jgi:apurinic endonuclease APN1